MPQGAGWREIVDPDQREPPPDRLQTATCNEFPSGTAIRS